MAEGTKMCLCGGTFLVLLYEAKKKGRKKSSTDSNTMSDSELFTCLVSLINPQIKNEQGGTVRTFASDYKLCRCSDINIAELTNEMLIQKFDNDIKTKYSEKLSQLNRDIKNTMNFEIKGLWLVAALIDLIESDNTILDDAQFFVQPDGSTIKKKDLRNIKTVCFPAFILGVWHYIITNVKDNTIGKETLNLLLKKQHEKRAGREFVSDIGKNSVYELEKTVKVIEYENSENSISESNIVVEEIKATNQKLPKIKVTYKSDILESGHDEDFFLNNKDIIELDDNTDTSMLKKNTIYLMKTTCEIEVCITFGMNIQVKINFTVNGIKFTGLSSLENWKSKSYVNNLAYIGNYECMLWFKVINPDSKMPQVQFLMIGEAYE